MLAGMRYMAVARTKRWGIGGEQRKTKLFSPHVKKGKKGKKKKII